MSKISLDAVQLRKLWDHAQLNGTAHHWPSLALEWADAVQVRAAELIAENKRLRDLLGRVIAEVPGFAGRNDPLYQEILAAAVDRAVFVDKVVTPQGTARRQTRP
jgi:hypothetical protein